MPPFQELFMSQEFWSAVILALIGGGSNLIRAVQHRLNLTADGLLGPATIRAIQRHLGVAQDSWFGPGTARALQTRLNTGKF